MSTPKFGRLRTGRATYREQIEAANKGDRHYAMLSGKPAQFQTELAPKRAAIVNHSDDIEAPVIRAVTEMLALHPNVLFAVRQNSGSMPDAKGVPIWFYRMVRNPEPMTITDFWLILRDGRFGALECKKPSWDKPATDREYRQAAFINMVRELGGIGGFVRSTEEAIKCLRD